MGSNLIVAAVTLLLQSSPTDTTKPSPIQQSGTAPTGPAAGLAFERLSDVFQYNRVQGLSLGIGYRLPLPGLGPTAVYGTVRYGFSDERVTGRVSLVHDSPKGRLLLSGFHDIIDLDPFSPGRSIANTVNSLFAAHDNGDYALADGAVGRIEESIGRGLDLSLAARAEHQYSTVATARSAINDFLGGSGWFPLNPPVRQALFGGLEARLRVTRRIRWSLVVDLLGGAGQTTGRLYGDLRRGLGPHREIAISLKGGIGTEPALPQTLFRLGGLQTVRGFEYATVRSPAFWAAQLDLSPWRGRVSPVIFVDAGQGARTADLFSSKALVGAGAGVALFRGLVRLDFSRPVSPAGSHKVRFDLVIQGVR